MNRPNIDEDIRVEKRANGTEVFIFEPFNPLNREIPTKEIQKFLSAYGVNVPIHNYQLYKRAFIHQSYTRRPNLENA